MQLAESTAVSLMLTPDRVIRDGTAPAPSPRVTIRLIRRWLPNENGYLKFWTRLFESVLGGQNRSGILPSSAGLDGPDRIASDPNRLYSAPTLFAATLVACTDRGGSEEIADELAAHNYSPNVSEFVFVS